MPKIEKAWASLDDWNDISNEPWREYTFVLVADVDRKITVEHKLRIEEPKCLWVSAHGHRIITKDGRSLYVPYHCGYGTMVLIEWGGGGYDF